MKKVLIGTVTLDRDTVMHNNQFQYAASFEDLTVPEGKYPIYAYEDDIETTRKGERRLGWRNYIGFEGTVIESNVGGKPGNHTCYHVMTYGYNLADLFINNREYVHCACMEYELRPEWGIELSDFVSTFDGKRHFCKEIVLKDGQEFTYIE